MDYDRTCPRPLSPDYGQRQRRKRKDTFILTDLMFIVGHGMFHHMDAHLYARHWNL